MKKCNNTFKQKNRKNLTAKKTQKISQKKLSVLCELTFALFAVKNIIKKEK